MLLIGELPSGGHPDQWAGLEARATKAIRTVLLPIWLLGSSSAGIETRTMRCVTQSGTQTLTETSSCAKTFGDSFRPCLPCGAAARYTEEQIWAGAMDARHSQRATLSAAGADLLDGLLALDPAERLSASRALEHAWCARRVRVKKRQQVYIVDRSEGAILE